MTTQKTRHRCTILAEVGALGCSMTYWSVVVLSLGTWVMGVAFLARATCVAYYCSSLFPPAKLFFFAAQMHCCYMTTPTLH